MLKRGDKVKVRFRGNFPESMTDSSEPEYEVYEVLDYGELCRLKHIKTGAVQGGVSSERLIKC